MTVSIAQLRDQLAQGWVIPASPLALTANRRLDERRQRALWRYYSTAGSGGIAIGVHTTQFAIRNPKIGLFEPLLALGQDEMGRLDESAGPESQPLIRIGGCCGATSQATAEAEILRRYGYHAALLSLAALQNETVDELVSHCEAVSEVIPIIGFYLQPAVGGRVLPYEFWRRFAEIENVVAIKMAPFNRYYTLDVMRAIIESGRDDVALYTGNDDNIVMDLLTPFKFTPAGGEPIQRRIVGGLLGHWSVWVKKAVELLDECHDAVDSVAGASEELLVRSVEVTDCNAAFFDAANSFAGCIAGLHEVLRRQGLLEGLWCLDPDENLSPGQMEEIDRVYAAYPHLNDDDFVAAHRDQWLSG